MEVGVVGGSREVCQRGPVFIIHERNLFAIEIEVKPKRVSCLVHVGGVLNGEPHAHHHPWPTFVEDHHFAAVAAYKVIVVAIPELSERVPLSGRDEPKLTRQPTRREGGIGQGSIGVEGTRWRNGLVVASPGEQRQRAEDSRMVSQHSLHCARA